MPNSVSGVLADRPRAERAGYRADPPPGFPRVFSEVWREFAHGYCTLEPDTEVLYKVSAYYDPACERGLAWDDPTVAINWPFGPLQVVLADKDRTYPRLADVCRVDDFRRSNRVLIQGCCLLLKEAA
jgi:hypothetical protein